MAAGVTVELGHAEALVLFELLERVDASFAQGAQDAQGAVAGIALIDMAEMMALWSVKAQLDRQLVDIFSPNYRAALAAAREELRRQSGAS
jgi:hypothetical protein